MLFFDAHVHVGNFSVKQTEENSKLFAYAKYQKNSADKYHRLAVRKNISKAVCFPFPFCEISFSKQNQYVLDAAAKYPYLFLPLVLPDKTDMLEKNAGSFYGIKDHFYFDFHEKIDRMEVLDFAQQYNKVYIFHAHWKKWDERISLIAKNFPKLKVIVAHSARVAPFAASAQGSSFEDRLLEIKSLIPEALLENFYFETSTIRDPSSIRSLVNTFGSQHVLWGTDYPYYSNDGEDVYDEEIRCIQESQIDDESKERIFSGNFRDLFQKGECWIRHGTKDDAPALLEMTKTISREERKFLAYDKKEDLIRTQIKKGSHVLVAESQEGKIMGFLRFSDRYNDSVMIEEVYVDPQYRGQKVARKLVTSLVPAHSKSCAKSFANNQSIYHVFSSLGFSATPSPKGTMIAWEK